VDTATDVIVPAASGTPSDGRERSYLDEVMQHAVDEAARLLDANGAFVDLVDRPTGLLRTEYFAGVADWRSRELLSDVALAPGQGVMGQALDTLSVQYTEDYEHDDRFAHMPSADAFASQLGIRSMIAAPLVGSDGPLGVLAAYADRTHAFGEADEALIRALADHAAAQMTTLQLIEQLQASRDELAARLDAERALRAISSRITSIREPQEVLQRVVDEAKRLLESDASHLMLRSESDHLYTAVMAGVEDDETRRWLHALRLPPRSGLNALAVETGHAVWTEDYAHDPRIPLGPDDDAKIQRMRIGAMATAPLRGPAGEVLGTLGVSWVTPRRVPADGVRLLQALGDQAAVALLNSRLYERQRVSEERYRFLVERSPDLVFRMDAEARFTFVSEGSVAFTGYRPDELMGQHFSLVTDATSIAATAALWERIRSGGERSPRIRLLQRRKDGSTNPIEIHASPIVVDGVFQGLQGAARDLSDSDRLERDVRRQTADIAGAEERAHLARELHDSVTQALFSMTLTTRSIELLVQRDPAAARERLADLRGLQKDALAEMRALVFALRPGSLEKDGLVQALRTYAAALEQRSGLPVDVEAAADDRLPSEIEDTLYRIAQEALHNVIKHARAGRARVSIVADAREATLVVEDDGRGFDADAIPAGHLGVAGMKARAQSVGGRVAVESASGRGTRITVSVPLQPA
jgi:PAS domain S-box-containing protein